MKNKTMATVPFKPSWQWRAYSTASRM